MADIKLSTVVGSGGGVPKFRAITSGTIPSGTAAGDILTVNASSGMLVRFKWLVNAAGAEINISIVIDGITVITNRELTDVTPTASIASGEFGIFSNSSAKVVKGELVPALKKNIEPRGFKSVIGFTNLFAIISRLYVVLY